MSIWIHQDSGFMCVGRIDSLGWLRSPFGCFTDASDWDYWSEI